MFLVTIAPGLVEGWAGRALPFEPKGWLLDYREALRTGLRGIDASLGHVLLARYTAPEGRACDVENVLLYNVGHAAFSHIPISEVSLFRSFRPSPQPPTPVDGEVLHHHRYTLSPSSGGGRQDGVAIAQWNEVPLRPPLTVEHVWYALRSSSTGNARETHVIKHLGLDLTLHRPPLLRPALLGLVKILIDGVVSAFHVHDGQAVDVVAGRLSDRLGLSRERLVEVLVNNPRAVLGARRLLWPYRDFVQWNPADDLLIDIRVRTAPASAWAVSGTLLALPQQRTGCG